MRSLVYSWNDTNSSIYYLDTAGEMVPRHRHTVEHTTAVIKGKTVVRIWREAEPELHELNELGPVLVLPSDIDHEIEALVPGTIICNMQEGNIATTVYGDTGTPGKAGGIALHDGTVVDA